jgi:hypothetical protein
MNAQEFVRLMGQLNKTGQPYSLGTIDPNYTSGLPKVIFDGESTPSLKAYTYASGYTPRANDRVIIANVGGSHVILGGVVNDALINKWQNITLPSGWSNFGSGYSNAQFMKTSYNTVKLRGLVKPPSSFTSGLIFTLPVGYRPKSADIYSALMKRSDSSVGVWQCTVGSDGAVTSGSFTGLTSGMLWMSLAGVEIDLS